MRFSSAAVAAFCVLSASDTIKYGDSFSVAPPMVTRTNMGRSSLAPLQFKMPETLVEPTDGMEALEELTENIGGSALEKQIQKSPSFWKMAGYATIPVSAALGFGIVPSRRLAAHAAGAIVTGVAGAIGKSKLDSVTESAALPAIAQTILDYGIEDPRTTFGYIQSLQELFGIVDDVDFQAMRAEVYSQYLLGMVRNPVASTNEPIELAKLRNALGLDNVWVGEAHAAAAKEWYKTTCLFTPEEELDDPAHVDRQRMDKFLFLTERALTNNGETTEAFSFEMARVAKSMKLSTMDAMERIADIGEPHYRTALSNIRANLGSGKFSEGSLIEAQLKLGIDENTAHDMHLECFSDEVQKQLGLGDVDGSATTIKFKDGAEEKVSDHVLHSINHSKRFNSLTF